MDDSRRAIIEQWKKAYPVEAVFVSEITEHINDLLQRLRPNPNFRDGDRKQLGLWITRRKETDYLEILMDDETMFFLGSMSAAISKTIITELLPNIQPETKKCTVCSTTNNKIAKFCYQCGNKIEDI